MDQVQRSLLCPTASNTSSQIQRTSQSLLVTPLTDHGKVYWHFECYCAQYRIASLSALWLAIAISTILLKCRHGHPMLWREKLALEIAKQ